MKTHIQGIFHSLDKIKGVKEEVIVHRLLIVGVIFGGIVFGLWIKAVAG